MDVLGIDHVNLRIPVERVGDATSFYGETLGFEPEGLEAYRDGERELFTFRLNETAVIHFRPIETFEPKEGDGFDHVAIVFDASVEEIAQWVNESGAEIERTGTPLGATGRAPAVYFRDPFGYLVEAKARPDGI